MAQIVQSLQQQQKVLASFNQAPNLTQMANRGPNLKILQFDATQFSDFETWLKEFERKYRAGKWPETRKAATLAGFLKGQAELAYNRLATGQQDEYDTLVAELVTHHTVTGSAKVNPARQRFEQRHQLAGGSIGACAVEISKLSETALSILTVTNEWYQVLRDRFISGLLSQYKG